MEHLVSFWKLNKVLLLKFYSLEAVGTLLVSVLPYLLSVVVNTITENRGTVVGLSTVLVYGVVVISITSVDIYKDYFQTRAGLVLFSQRRLATYDRFNDEPTVLPAKFKQFDTIRVSLTFDIKSAIQVIVELVVIFSVLTVISYEISAALLVSLVASVLVLKTRSKSLNRINVLILKMNEMFFRSLVKGRESVVTASERHLSVNTLAAKNASYLQRIYCWK